MIMTRKGREARDAHAAKSRIAVRKVEAAAFRHAVAIEANGVNALADGTIRVSFRTTAKEVPAEPFGSFLKEVGTAFDQCNWHGGAWFEAIEPGDSEMFQ